MGHTCPSTCDLTGSGGDPNIISAAPEEMIKNRYKIPSSSCLCFCGFLICLDHPIMCSLEAQLLSQPVKTSQVAQEMLRPSKDYLCEQHALPHCTPLAAKVAEFC